MSEVSTIILTHQRPEYIVRMLDYWARFTYRDSILLAFGGAKDLFAAIEHPHRILIDSPKLRTRNHQREKQSYADVFRLSWDWVEKQPCKFVVFVEFDHIPLVQDFHKRMTDFAEQEKSDLAGYHVEQIDGTSHPHYLYHAADPEFLPFWENISVRPNKHAVLTMMGTGSFWRKEAFGAVATLEEKVRTYLEIFQPTAAHHLGFRVRNFGQQSRFMISIGDVTDRVESFRSRGAWSTHPVKQIWGGSAQPKLITSPTS